MDWLPQVRLEPGGFTTKFGIRLDMSIQFLGLPQSMATGEEGRDQRPDGSAVRRTERGAIRLCAKSSIYISIYGGSSLMVEYSLAKAKVEGSSPFFRL